MDRLAHNYTTDDYSPVIDAGNPTDPHPPATGETVDIGYIEQGRAAYYVDDDYCAGDGGRDCLNDGLTWGVDAFASIQEALDVAREEQLSFGRETAGDIVCRVYHSADTPQDIISSTREVETFSSVAVPHSGQIVDINVHNARGAHGCVSDLDIILQSPSGIMARLFAPATCDQADFDLNFDDEAEPGSPPCPPTDGGDYQPVQALAKYDGDEAAGVWVLHVRDVVTGTGGSLDAWGLEICTRQTPPPLTVGVGPGVYTETLDMPSYVRLIGVDPDEVTLDAQGAGVPVTFDGVVQSELSGFAITGNDGGEGVVVRGTSKNILISRNLIRDNGAGVGFIEGATGRVSFNTIGNHDVRGSSGVYARDAGSQVAVENNIIRNYDQRPVCHQQRPDFLRLQPAGRQWRSFQPGYDCERLRQDRQQRGLRRGRRFSHHAGLSRAGQRLAARADPARRRRAGRHRLSRADGAARDCAPGQGGHIDRHRRGGPGRGGIRRGRCWRSPRARQRHAAGYLADGLQRRLNASAIQTTWRLTTTPAAGLHRIYSRAEDGVGNRPEDAQTWYIGAFVADDTAPTVTWIAPPPGPVSTTVSTTLELRAQAWDEVAGQFSVDQVQFEVDGQSRRPRGPPNRGTPPPGSRVASGRGSRSRLAHPPVWLPWRMTRPAIAARARRSNCTSRQPPHPILISPTLTVISPASGSGVQPPVVFRGTVTDTGGSGVASVEVSLDNGVTWQPAAVTGDEWTLTWHPPWQQDYVTYPALVRASDQAGNRATEAVAFAIDNVPPTIDTRYGYRTRFWQEQNPFYGRQQTHPGEHFDYPAEITIWAGWPWDGSDVAGDSLRYQYAADQNPDTPPDLAGDWHPRPQSGSLPTATFILPGEWYVHLFYRDQSDNIAIKRYGPWHVGNFADTLVHCNSRVQTIELDGYLDVARYEWTEREFLDDDERGMAQGYERQSLYASWDGEGFYVGWQGAWWDVDGEMWVYLDTATALEDDGATHTVEWPRHDLPFKADMAIRVSGQEAMTFYEYHNDQWWPVSYSYYDGSHSVSGGTEVKFHLKHDLTALQDIRMLAYARDNDDQVWTMFPTTNPLEGDWEAYYHWNTVCNPLLVINANQPRYTSMAMYVAGEAPQTAAKTARLIGPGVQARGAWATTPPSSSGNAVGGILGPGSQVTYTIALENRETYTTPVLTLEILSPLEDAYTLPMPPMPPGENYTITLTQTLPDDLAGITTLPFTATLALSDTVLARDWLAYLVDSHPPTLTLDSQIVCPGAQTISGRANDGDGGGLRAIQISTDGVTWQDVVGRHNWTADVTVPTGVETLDVWLRAVDVFSQALNIPFTLRTDTNAPTLTLDLPAYLTGDYGKLDGMATDVGSWIERVEVQIGAEDVPWQAGDVYPANGGEQRWVFTWNLPRADGVPAGCAGARRRRRVQRQPADALDARLHRQRAARDHDDAGRHGRAAWRLSR